MLELASSAPSFGLLMFAMGPKAEVNTHIGDFRSSPQQRALLVRAATSEKCQQETHAAQQIASPFDRLVGAGL
jgi:hypothetical protein